MHTWRHTLFVYLLAFKSSHSQAFFSPWGKNIFARFSIFYKNVLRKKTFGMRDYRILHEVTVLCKNYVRFHPHKK